MAVLRSRSLFACLLFASITVSVSADPPQWTTGTYTYDGAGNIIGVGPNSDGKTNYYRYDPAGRLVDATAHTASADNVQHYDYDVFGNLLRIDTNGQSLSIGIDPEHNQIRSSGSGGGAVATATYDPAGNQTSLNGVYAYDYDGLNAMTSLIAGTRKERYLYDSEGERVAVITGTPASQHWRVTIRDGAARVARELTDDTNGTAHQWLWARDWLFSPSGVLAEVRAEGGGETRRHFHTDSIGTPRLVTEDDGRVSARQTLLPFGNFAPGSERSGAILTFTGHERDFAAVGDDNALDYMHARYYSPTLGRFLSVDPVITGAAASSPQFWNRYAYVGNNPLGRVDPDGRVFILSACAKDPRSKECGAQYKLYLSTFGDQAKEAGQFLRVGQNGMLTFYGISGAAFASKFGLMGRATNVLVSNRVALFTLNVGRSNLTESHKGGYCDCYESATKSLGVDPSKGSQMLAGVLVNTTETLVHEIGHAVASLFPGRAWDVGQVKARSPLMKEFDGNYEGYATAFENVWRHTVLRDTMPRTGYAVAGDVFDTTDINQVMPPPPR